MDKKACLILIMKFDVKSCGKLPKSAQRLAKKFCENLKKHIDIIDAYIYGDDDFDAEEDIEDDGFYIFEYRILVNLFDNNEPFVDMVDLNKVFKDTCNQVLRNGKSTKFNTSFYLYDIKDESEFTNPTNEV